MRKEIKSICNTLKELPTDERAALINEIKIELHKISPFKEEPVDCVLWVKADRVEANDYNPNSVAAPEMELLAHSIATDGYTQPIVSWDKKTHYEVIDGFHRTRVGKEITAVSERTKGYLPVTLIQNTREDRSDRIASTIRHNRARGKHAIAPMSDIVVELKKRNWSDLRIGKELGMDPDEVLRLTQITGLTDMFADQDFSEAWEPANGIADELHEMKNDTKALEWVNSPVPDEQKDGWHDRTAQSSILYGQSPRIRGMVQKSHVLEKWHWYSYKQPLVSGESKSRRAAKCAVSSAWRIQ